MPRSFPSRVVGVTKRNPDGTARQDLIEELTEGEVLELVPDPENDYDPDAIQVCTGTGEQIGFIRAELASEITGYLEEEIPVEAVVAKITGGEPGKPAYGVNIRLVIYDGESEEDQARREATRAAHRPSVERLANRTPVKPVPLSKRPISPWIAVGAAILLVWALAGLFDSGPPDAAPDGAEPAVPAPAGVVIDVPALAGQTPERVAALLGPPTETGTTRADGTDYPSHDYRGGQVEITYIGGRAEWITVNWLGALPFGPDALPSLGLHERGSFDGEPVAPTSAGATAVHWEDGAYPGFLEVHIFRDPAGGIEYALFRVSRDA